MTSSLVQKLLWQRASWCSKLARLSSGRVQGAWLDFSSRSSRIRLSPLEKTVEKSHIDEVLTFWYDELTPKEWFGGGPELDAQIQKRFGALLRELAQQPVDALTTDPRRALAAVLVLDQFSRNVYRGSALAFAQDPLALAIARQLVNTQADQQLSQSERYFLYMPFMHSESLADHERSLALYKALGDENGIHWAKDHHAVIAQFGRYPHRNDVLGRESTPEELRYLENANRYGQ